MESSIRLFVPLVFFVVKKSSWLRPQAALGSRVVNSYLIQQPDASDIRLSQGDATIIGRDLLVGVDLETQLLQSGFQALAQGAVLKYAAAQRYPMQPVFRPGLVSGVAQQVAQTVVETRGMIPGAIRCAHLA